MTRIYPMSLDMSKPSSSVPATDCHFHVFEAGVGQAGSRYIPAYAAPLAQWQALAQAQGVERGVLVQTSFMGSDNRLLLACLRAEPHRLRGVAVVEPDVDVATLQALDAAGVRGIRLNLAGRFGELDRWTGCHGLWDAMLPLGWHLELHTDSGALPHVLPRLLPHLPAALPLVLDHMGKPDTARRDDPSLRLIQARARHTEVFVKLSGAYRLGVDPTALARLWLEEIGPERLLWGSDWPCTNHESAADYPALFASLTDWLPTPAHRHAALHDNPQRLYWR